MRSRMVYVVIAISLTIAIVGLAFGSLSGFGGRGHGMGRTIPQSFWLVLIIVPLVVAIYAFGYAMLFPELSEKKPEEKSSLTPVPEKGESAIDAVLRVLKEDEGKVVKTLVEEGGTMLQKDIRWKLGLSRVKTHRILYRLAERGIVTAEKHYNTNKITLSDWLMKNKNG